MSEDKLRSIIIAAIARVQPAIAGIKVTNATTLSELGVDSVALVEVGFHLESQLGEAVRFDEWLAHERCAADSSLSIGSLIAYLIKATAAP